MTTARTIDFRYAPASRWTAICRPDDPHKTLVREDGALLYDFHSSDFAAWHFGRVFEFGIQTDGTIQEVAQRTESARVPVVVTTIRYPRATLELRAFAHQHDGDRRSDVVLWRITAADDVDELLTGLRLEALERGRVFCGRSSAPAREVFSVETANIPRATPWADPTAPEDETLPAPGPLALVSVPAGLRVASSAGFRPTPALASEPVILRAGESVAGALVFPLNHAAAAGVDLAWAEAALEAERAFWASYPVQPLAMELPDQGVMDMVTACARNILQAREIKDGLPVFQVGATCYRGLWVVDGHFIIECAQYLGHAAEAEAALDTLLTRVRPNGAIAQFEFHTKETGIALTTLVRQCELLGDDRRLRAAWPVVRDAVGYIEGLREEACALPPDHPAHRLLPVAFADGGLAGERPEYTTALWTLVGLRTIADAARRLGYAEDAARFGADYESLMADFRASAARCMGELPDGTHYLPMCLPGSGEHHTVANFAGTPPPWRRIQPETATWAYAQAVWPGELFAPDDPLVQNLLHLLDLRDDEEGVPATTGWLPYRALWNYAASFYAHAWLYAGRPDKAVDYLYAYANHATPTRVWREEQSLTATQNGQYVGDMPHNWASAEFIRLVRHLLVFERGEALELLPGLPPEWLAPGKRVYLERTPTRFGPVTLELTLDAQGRGEVRVRRVVRPARTPEAVRLTLPAGAEAVVLDGRMAEVRAGALALDPLAHEATVSFRLA